MLIKGTVDALNLKIVLFFQLSELENMNLLQLPNCEDHLKARYFCLRPFPMALSVVKFQRQEYKIECWIWKKKHPTKLMCVCTMAVRVVEFSNGVYKIRKIFACKNQHTQRIFLNFENWISAGPQTYLKLIISFFYHFWYQNWDQWHKMSRKNVYGCFSTHFVPLISIFAPKIMVELNNQL